LTIWRSGHDHQDGLSAGPTTSAGIRFIWPKAAAAADLISGGRLAADEAVQAAGTVLFTVPNQLGVGYNSGMLATNAAHIAPAIGWTPATAAAATRSS